jgi:hypothetical protein
MALTKRCRECARELELDLFPKQPGGRLGRHPLCKACRAAQERERYQRKREELTAAMRADPARQERARWRRRRRLGVDPQTYEAMWRRQGGRCAICDESAGLVVDHDHWTGAVRGLLCSCNLALGCFDDKPERLAGAARYLRDAS